MSRSELHNWECAIEALCGANTDKMLDIAQDIYNTAFVHGKNYMLLEQPEWIPVSERLPEIVEWYLTSIKWADGTERVTISWFDGMSFKAEVKAWMPLSEPYKEGLE